jgi:hypothetical protein
LAKKFRLTAQKPFIPDEYAEQCVVFEWLKYCKLDGADLAFSSLYGIRLPIGLAVKAKKAGMKSGVPDIFLPVPRTFFETKAGHELWYHGLFIEMKREKGGVVSQAQKDWREALESRGYKVVVAKGAKEAIAAIKEYLD